jgi:putative ABC transport system permease protein
LRAVPVGILFGIGMIAGLVVGLVTCYQVLFNEVVDRIAQYATLKAMGFGDRFLSAVVIAQGLLLSCTGFAIGAGLSLVANTYIERRTFIAADFGAVSVLAVFLATVAICVGGSLLAVRQLYRLDPASLY